MSDEINPIFRPRYLCLSLSVTIFIFVPAFSALAANPQMSVPTSSGKQLTEVIDKRMAMSLPLPLSDETLKNFEKSVNADLAAGRPVAAAVILDQFDPSKISDARMKDRIIALLEKTSEALHLRGKSFPDNVALTKSISISTKLLTLINKSKEPGRLAFAQLNLGKSLSVHGARFGDHPEMEKGIATLRTASAAWTVENAPERWAEAQLSLAEALIASARISESTEKFEEAIDVCQVVMDQQKVERLDQYRTEAKAIMSNALWQYGFRQRDADLHYRAMSLAQESLDQTDKEIMPFKWATTLNYLANASREYSYHSGDGTLLAKALDYYAQSLVIRNRENYPLEWAQTQLDYGNALGSYWYGASGDTDAHPATQAYLQSLQIRTRTETPLEWAMSQNNLAATIISILPRTPKVDSTKFAAALERYRLALGETTRERSPIDWALMKTNLGNALVTYYNETMVERFDTMQREQDAAMRAQANYPLEKSVEMHQAAMAKVRAKFESVDELKEALQHFDDVLSLYSRQAHPWRWLYVSNEKAGVLEDLSLRTNDASPSREAIAIYREQQTLIQRQYDQAHWARIEKKIAEALSRLAYMTRDPAKLTEAETSFANVIEALPQNGSEEKEMLLRQLADTKCYRGKMSYDMAAIEDGVAIYNELIKAGTASPRGTKNYFLQQAVDKCREIKTEKAVTSMK